MSTVSKTFLSQAQTLSKQNISSSVDEYNIIILGSEKSGKSTIFNMLFNSKKDNNLDVYSQTCGINFTFLNKEISSYSKKLVNGYEIGGGIENINLIESFITEESILKTKFLITFDLSSPYLFLSFLKEILDKINEILSKKCTDEFLKDLINKKKINFKSEKDKESSILTPIDLTLIGTKYDLLEKLEV